MTHKEASTILSPEDGLPGNAANSLALCRRIACLCAAALLLNESGAQEIMVLPFAPAPTPQPSASASAKPAPPPKLNRQRYDVRQTFDGGSYEKDNHVWVYDRDFAELFGMPEKHIEPIVGAVAAAYRIEDLGYQLCGLGGVDKNCMPTKVCRLDLYFDEAKTPLPWATELRQQWVPEHSSLWWLKPQDPRDRPGLRYNDDYTPYNADPTDPAQRRDLFHRMIDSALERNAIAPMWADSANDPAFELRDAA